MRLLNRRPDAVSRVPLPVLPLLLVVVAYAVASGIRLAANPSDRLLPSATTLMDAIRRVAWVADPRTGQVILWSDTAASLSRLAQGLCISATASFVLAILIGLLPLVRATLGLFVDIASMVPPVALLPILFIAVGLGETSKVLLIVIGTLPVLVRDLSARVLELPSEQLVKAQTLGATTWQVALRVTVPQMLPRLIDALRLALGPAWLFLISAEAIASDGASATASSWCGATSRWT